MRKTPWLWVLLLVLWLAGCCSQPGVFQKLHNSLTTVQGFYDPLLGAGEGQGETWRQAVVAADSALLLAGELQQQWCPDLQAAQQVELQTQTAVQLAQAVGVGEAGLKPASGTGNNQGK
jgi:hypothetical protein